MSLVTVQLGQCGNQIGCQLFNTLMSDINTSDKSCSSKLHTEYQALAQERFFRPLEKRGETSQVARAVMVDMETKVIAQTALDAKRSGTWEYSSNQQFCLKKGSGNNWAHGYCVHGPAVRDGVMEIVRTEVEKCDFFGGFLALMSLAGGTGSGVGAYISECLRDDYPRCFLMNQVVWPYHTGEVIVQNYNAILTLSHLYQSSDAILALHNDALQRICSQLLGLNKVSFKDINQVVAHKLASVFLPVFKDQSRDSLIQSHIGDILSELVSHPEYKLLSLRNIPQMSDSSKLYSSYKWPGLIKHLRQMLVADSPMEEGINWQIKASPSNTAFNKSIANMVIARGYSVEEGDFHGFTDPYLYTSWMPPSCAFSLRSHPRSFVGYEKSATLLSTSQTAVAPLEGVIGKAWHMFASRAYVHQYLRHGLGEEDFLDSFASLEQILTSYKQL